MPREEPTPRYGHHDFDPDAGYPKRPHYDGPVQYMGGGGSAQLPTDLRPIPAAQEALSQVIAELAEVQDLVLRRLAPVRNRKDGLAAAANPEPEPARSELHHLLTTQRRQLQEQLLAWREVLEDLEI